MSLEQYKIGQLARVIFPCIARKGIDANTLAFLTSKESSSLFHTHGFPVLKKKRGLREEWADADGMRRYYSSDLVLIGDTEYLLCSQFSPVGKKSLIDWASQHGCTEEELIKHCEECWVC